eukprot:9239426-Pyramimonas_sp.AAC.1
MLGRGIIVTCCAFRFGGRCKLLLVVDAVVQTMHDHLHSIVMSHCWCTTAPSTTTTRATSKAASSFATAPSARKIPGSFLGFVKL